jgi:hypothetical protein
MLLNLQASSNFYSVIAYNWTVHWFPILVFKFSIYRNQNSNSKWLDLSLWLNDSTKSSISYYHLTTESLAFFSFIKDSFRGFCYSGFSMLDHCVERELFSLVTRPLPLLKG